MKTVRKEARKAPAKPQDQVSLIVSVLRGGHTMTRLTAYHAGVANLTAVVAAARKCGHKIVTNAGVDALDRKYTYYTMV